MRAAHNLFKEPYSCKEIVNDSKGGIGVCKCLMFKPEPADPPKVMTVVDPFTEEGFITELPLNMPNEMVPSGAIGSLFGIPVVIDDSLPPGGWKLTKYSSGASKLELSKPTIEHVKGLGSFGLTTKEATESMQKLGAALSGSVSPNDKMLFQIGRLVPGLKRQGPVLAACPEILAGTLDSCPSAKSAVAGGTDRLMTWASWVIHLNDYHKWSWQRIVEWLEHKGVDLDVFDGDRA